MREWLKDKRLSKGLTLNDVAERAGVSWQSISYYENGERRPSPETAIKIGAVLEFDWKRFYEKEQKGGGRRETERKTGEGGRQNDGAG